MRQLKTSYWGLTIFLFLLGGQKLSAQVLDSTMINSQLASSYKNAIGLVNSKFSSSDTGTYLLFFDIEYKETQINEFNSMSSNSPQSIISKYFEMFGTREIIPNFKTVNYPKTVRTISGRELQFVKNYENYQITFGGNTDDNEMLILEQVSVNPGLHFLFVVGKIK